MLGTDVIVKADAFLERAVCHDHVYVGPGTNLRGCVIGRNTDLRAHVRVRGGHRRRRRVLRRRRTR